MRAIYLLIPALASVKAIANPMGAIIDGAIQHVTRPALDPLPTGPLFPSSIDGELPDKSIINYTPNAPSNQGHSCWTQPLSRPPASDPIKHGLCSVCVVQRHSTDGSADYLLWARDNDNNAMGNMGQTTIWPIDATSSTDDVTNASVLVGGSSLLLQTQLSSTAPQDYSQVTLLWAIPPHDPTDPNIWSDLSAPRPPTASFDASSKDSFGENCTSAGSATNGAVVYAICFFSC